MAAASALVANTADMTVNTSRASALPADRLARASCLSAIVVVLVAPFEALRPLVALPGQSFTTVETTLLCVIALCGIVATRERRWLPVSSRDMVAWTCFVGAALASALLARDHRANALHMAGRLGVAAIVWGVTCVGGRTETARRRIAGAVVVSAAIVSALVVLDFAGVRTVQRVLEMFRTGIAVVGGHARASGPFQYPTIASMFLEIGFALGLGLFISMSSGATRSRAGLIFALALIAEAVVLTFTRSGLITIWLSLAAVAAIHIHRQGVTTSVMALTALAAVMAGELFASQSAELLRLRFSSEGQGQWFSAAIDAPGRVALDNARPIDVPLRITNTGRATWDSRAEQPIRLSYHWIAEDSDEVIAWEGRRTLFDRPVRPGETISVTARVSGPGRPGRYRLMWDIEQANRLWFSTEPDAVPAFSSSIVTGRSNVRQGRAPMARRIPTATERPGRWVLWSAAAKMWAEHPVLGVGPDNFRLLYGRYSPVRVADPRVHSNNMYVEVLAGMGLVGLGAFLWLGRRLWRAATAAAAHGGLGLGVAAAFGAVAVHGLVDSFLSFTATYIVMAVVAGLACAHAPDGVRDADCI